MRINGKMAPEGYTKQDIDALAEAFGANPGHEVCVYNLAERTGLSRAAYVLVIRRAFKDLCDSVADDLQHGVFPSEDRKMWNERRKQVQQRHARYCCCIGDAAVEPDISKGIGCVVSFDTIPAVAELRNRLTFAGMECDIPKLCDLNGEVNHYYDAKKCYIGFHGDGERPDVVGFVVGASKTLHFQGFCGADPVGERLEIIVHHGDLYVMCEVACGHNWKAEIAARGQGVVHYRHAACDPRGHRCVPTNEKIMAARAQKASKRVLKRAREGESKEEDGKEVKKGRGGSPVDGVEPAE